MTVDGTGGELALGRVRVTSGEGSPQLGRLLAWADEVAGRPGGGSCPGMETGPEAEEARLRAAHTALRG